MLCDMLVPDEGTVTDLMPSHKYIKSRVFILYSTFFFANGIDLLLWLYSAHYKSFYFGAKRM